MVGLNGWIGELPLQNLHEFESKITDIAARVSGEDRALAEKVAQDVARRIAQNEGKA